MRIRISAVVLLALPVLACRPAATPSAETASLILENATVWTGDVTQPRASAIATRDGRILAVGTTAALHAHRGTGTQVIDLDGAMVVPGFIDSHVHFAYAARLLLGINLLDVDNESAFVTAVREAHARMPDGAWLVKGDWSAYQRWPKGAEKPLEGEIDFFAPDRRMVDEITGDRPMLLSRFDRKVWFANGAALKAAGIDGNTKDPAGGKIVRRDETGEPTGLLEGTAYQLVEKVVPEPSHEQRVAETQVALQRVRENGVTTFHDMSDEKQMRIYQELLAKGELTARVNYRPSLAKYEHLEKLGVAAGFGGPWIRIGGTKGFVDGIMGNSSALFVEPYDHEPENHGQWRDMMKPAGNMERLLRGADRAGLQITVHAIGDAANRWILDEVEKLVAEHGKRDRRFRVVHAQVVHPDDIERFGELDLICEVQPYHAIDDMRWMAERIGDRSRWAYAFKSLQDAGCKMSFGSDWPGTNAAWYPISPLQGMYAATTRQTLTGVPEGGWYPEERIGAEDALRAYTVNNAFIDFSEGEKGTIAVGKLADLAVVDRDLTKIPAAEIKDAKILYTIVDGKIVYDASKSGQVASR